MAQSLASQLLQGHHFEFSGTPVGSLFAHHQIQQIIALLDLLQQPQAVLGGHVDVAQHELELALLERLERRAGVGRRADGRAGRRLTTERGAEATSRSRTAVLM